MIITVLACFVILWSIVGIAYSRWEKGRRDRKERPWRYK